jgi:hypothetical protein
VASILEAYARTPEDTDRVAALMQQMQQLGTPPAEIAGPGGGPAGAAACVVS